MIALALALAGCRPATLVSCDPAVEVPPSTPAAPGGDVLLILIDDIGLDKIAAYDLHPDPPRTPNIDALAARGVRFTNAYANPACTQSRASALTGRHASRTGVGRWGSSWETDYDLQLEERTLAELVQRSPFGYRSAALGKWHQVSFLRDDPGLHPLEQGFGYHAGSLANPAYSYQETDGELDYFYWEKSVDGAQSFTSTYMTTDTTDEALGQLDALPGPRFLWVAYNASHGPAHAPPAALLAAPLPDDPTDIELGDAMVEALDTEIGRLLAGLPAPETTTVILAGDNGTERWMIAEPWDNSRRKTTLYEGGVKVPLIIAGPDVAQPGSEVDALVHFVDLFPTVAELAGVDLEELADRACDGHSLLPWVQDPARPSARAAVYTEQFEPGGPPPYDSHERLVRTQDWKLVVTEEGERREQALYELVPGAWDEGDPIDPTTATQLDALEALECALEATIQSVTFGS